MPGSLGEADWAEGAKGPDGPDSRTPDPRVVPRLYTRPSLRIANGAMAGMASDSPAPSSVN
jgi:hypothetical protein